MDRAIALPEGVNGPPVFTDGFGSRFLGFDAESGDPIEILAFDSALVAAPDFGSAVGVRAARVSGARHTLFARVRRIERPASDSLLLVSDRVAGWRLAHVLDIANRVRLRLDTSAVLNLLRQLVPAVALFGRHQRDLTIGNIAPERLILTPQGRLVLAEYVLGDAIERLGMSRDDLWRTLRVPVAAGESGRDAARSDVLAIGVVALSLLLGRRLREDEFPFAMSDLLQLATETHGNDSRPLSPGLASWLGRALQLEGQKPLASPKEAQIAFEELLATERGYVTSPALLEAFIEQFDQRAGPPPEPSKPVPPAAPTPQHDPPVQPPVAAVVLEPPARGTEPSISEPPASNVAPPAPTLESPVDEPERAGPAIATPLVDGEVEPPRPDSSSPAPVTAAAESTYSAADPAVGVAEPGTLEDAKAETPAADGPASAEQRGRMTKLVAGLALLVVLEAAAIFWLWNRSAQALLRDGELVVDSRPAAARVSVDDDDVGVTPVTVRLAPGTYTIKVQHGDSEPRVIVVQIRAGVQRAQYLELQTGR